MFHLKLKPEWDEIRGAWDPCERHLSGHGLGHDESYALCMVARELLENAVKYGRFGEAGGSIQLGIDVAPQEVTVEVKSPVGVDSDHLREFDRTVQWIRGFQDPFEAYLERLKRVSARTSGEETGGLGLARIAYEGRCVIDFYVDASDTLAVSAVRRR